MRQQQADEEWMRVKATIDAYKKKSVDKVTRPEQIKELKPKKATKSAE